MFLKMVKHELHASFRALLPVLGGLLAMALLARFSIWLMKLADSPVASILGGLMIGLFVLGCFAAVVTTMILMMVRFARSVFGDEGYLTHTLPVHVSTILLSRLLVCFLAMAAAICVIFLGIQVATLGVKEAREFFREILDGLAEGEAQGLPLTKYCMVAILSTLTSILMIFAAIAIGHSFSTGKTGKSVLFYFVLYVGSQVVSSIALVVISAAVYFGGSGSFGVSKFANSMLWFSAAQSVIFGSLYYFLTWIMTKKRLNLG